MRTLGWVVVVATFLLSGCAGDESVRRAKADTGTAEGKGGSGEAGLHLGRYVDRQLGFEVARPSALWQLDVSNDAAIEGVATPVVLRNTRTGAQVVIQVAPAVASPHQFAQRLTEGMRSQPGFITSDPEPLALADEAVGFRFAMGERVYGRVAVRPGAEGRMLMLLATWPAASSAEATGDVDDVFRSVKPVPLAP